MKKQQPNELALQFNVLQHFHIIIINAQIIV